MLSCVVLASMSSGNPDPMVVESDDGVVDDQFDVPGSVLAQVMC